MIYRLDNNLWFPDPHRGDDDGLFAIGGDQIGRASCRERV